MIDTDKANKPIEDEIIITNEDDDEKSDAKIKDTSEVDADDAEDAEAKSRAERRSEERRFKKQRKNNARDKNISDLDHFKRKLDQSEHENSELANRLAQLESRALQNDSRELDGRLALESRRYQEAEMALANAMKTQDSDLFFRAQRQKDDAAFRLNEINSVKQRVAQQPSQSRINPMAAKLAREFTEDHPWIDLNGKDEDSLVALAVDKAVAADEFRMDSPEYWDELERRLEKRLPHRFKDDGDGSRKSAPVGGGKSGAASAKREFTFSPSRIEAMKSEGIWGDKAAMQRRAKSYQDYDRKNANS